MRGRLFSFVAVTVLVTANLEAQTGQGTILFGLVNDKTGARIALVTVRVTNKETNVVANSSTKCVWPVPCSSPKPRKVRRGVANRRDSSD